ncbi:MAG TPA: RDD family protein [Syntrophorhabdales bacterium]|nr:RDD family protein [Syntrophorhabdales bacterium]
MTRASAFARLFALMVDILFLLIVQFFLFTAAFAGHTLWAESISFNPLSPRLMEFSPVLSLSFLFVVLYYFTSLTSDGEQTIGKTVFGIRVVTREGEDLGRIRALLRCLCYGFSALPLFLGFLMAFVFRGNALHDILCRTKVIRVQDDW